MRKREVFNLFFLYLVENFPPGWWRLNIWTKLGFRIWDRFRTHSSSYSWGKQRFFRFRFGFGFRIRNRIRNWDRFRTHFSSSWDWDSRWQWRSHQCRSWWYFKQSKWSGTLIFFLWKTYFTPGPDISDGGTNRNFKKV